MVAVQWRTEEQGGGILILFSSRRAERALEIERNLRFNQSNVLIGLWDRTACEDYIPKSRFLYPAAAANHHVLMLTNRAILVIHCCPPWFAWYCHSISTESLTTHNLKQRGTFGHLLKHHPRTQWLKYQCVINSHSSVGGLWWVGVSHSILISGNHSLSAKYGLCPQYKVVVKFSELTYIKSLVRLLIYTKYKASGDSSKNRMRGKEQNDRGKEKENQCQCPLWQPVV